MKFDRKEIHLLLRLLDDRLVELGTWKHKGNEKFKRYMGELEGVEVLADATELAVTANFGGLKGKVVVPMSHIGVRIIGRHFGATNFILIDLDLAKKILVLGRWP